MPKQPDSAELIERLKTQGARIRLRKSGQVHTLDFSQSEPFPDDHLMRQLASLQSLEILDCSDAPLTDATVDALLEHRGLKLMTLSGTQISPEGLRRLRQNLIGCRIIA